MLANITSKFFHQRDCIYRRVLTLITECNNEHSEQVLGELKAARVMVTNAYALLNADRHEATDLVKQMQQDLEYFRRYAMPDPHRARDVAPDDEEPEQPVEPAE